MTKEPGIIRPVKHLMNEPDGTVGARDEFHDPSNWVECECGMVVPVDVFPCEGCIRDE